MERRMRGNSHVRCGVGENPEIVSKGYLSLYWEVLVGNCDSLLFLGGSDATTLEYVSKKLGKETISAVNRSRSYGKQGSYSMSYNKTGRELMTPDELSNMDNNNCVLFIRGLQPFFGIKYPLEKHPNYKRSGDGNHDLEFDVKTRLETAKKDIPPIIKECPARRIYTDAQRADTRESDRQHRQHSRPAETRSARDRELLKPKPLSEEIPALAKAPEDRTPAEQAQLEKTLDSLEVMEINDMSEEELMQYQDEIANMYFSEPPLEHYGTVPITSEEERQED